MSKSESESESADEKLGYAFIEALYGDYPLAEKMLRENPELISRQVGRARPAINYLAVEGEVEAVRWLIDHGADVDTRNEFDETPLRDSVSIAPLEMTQLLIGLGADVNASCDLGYSPLYWAAGFAVDQREIEFLIESGADIASPTPGVFKETPLGHAVCMENLPSVKTLLKHHPPIMGAQWNEIFEHLCLNPTEFCEPCLNLFAEAGVDFSLTDERDETLLHGAAFHLVPKAVGFFLSKGLSPTAKNVDGETPYESAKQSLAQWEEDQVGGTPAAHIAFAEIEALLNPSPE